MKIQTQSECAARTRPRAPGEHFGSNAPWTRSMAIVATLTALSVCSIAQAQLTPEWVAQRDGSGGLVATDSQGAVYVTGGIGESRIDANILTIKYAPDGTEVWAVVFDGPTGQDDAPKDITIDSAGNILVLALSECDFMVIKYAASDGSVIWTSQHDGGNCPESGTALTTDDAGNIYVTGFTRLSDPERGEDFYTYKMDSAGNVLWTAIYDGPFGAFLFSHDRAVDIALDSNGDVFVTGPSNDRASPNFVTIKYRGTDGARLWLLRVAPAGGVGTSVALLISPEDDVYVTGSAGAGGAMSATVKINGNDGSQMWQSINNQGFIFGETVGMALDSQGDVYVTGRLDPDGNRSNVNENIFTMRLRADTGARRWLSIFGGNLRNEFDIPGSIAIDAQDNVYVTGRTSSLGGFNDLLLLLYDAATGQIVDQGTYDAGGADSAVGRGLALDSAQNVIVGGVTLTDPGFFARFLTLKYPAQGGCYPDCDGSGVLDIFDFLCFQNSFVAGEPYACDCDTTSGAGVCDIFDFLCFQNAFVAGCP